MDGTLKQLSMLVNYDVSFNTIVLTLLIVVGILLTIMRKKKTNEARFVNICVEAGGKGGNFRCNLPIQRWISDERRQELGERRKNKKKRIVLLAYGTRGDIQPMIALALELKKEFEVCLCAPRSFEKFVKKYGVEYRYAGVDNVEQPQHIFENNSTSFADVMGVLNEVYRPLGDGMWKCCQEEEVDMIITTALVRSLAMHMAEKLEIPVFCVHFVASDVMTGNFPPIEYMTSLVGMKKSLPLFETTINKGLYIWRGIQIVRAAVSTGLAENDIAFRTTVVGLPKGDPLVGVKDVADGPQFHAYPSIVQPRPKDWQENVMLTGYWKLKQEEQQETDDHLRLDKFIKCCKGEGKSIVFVTFGSMELVDDLLELVTQTACGMGFHAIVGDTRGRVGVDGTTTSSISSLIKEGKVFLCDFNISHEKIFPQCDVIVHHGGAGTCAATLLSTVPSIVIPILLWSDQTYWASIIEDRGCGVALERVNCDKETVTQALQKASTKTIRIKSQQVANSLKEQPPGALVASKIVKRYLHELYCKEKNN